MLRPGRRGGTRRQPGRAHRLRRRLRVQLDDPAGHRLCGQRRSRQRAQRVVRRQSLSRGSGQPRPHRPGRQRGDRRGHDRGGVDRRRRGDQHHRLGLRRSQRHRGRGLDHLRDRLAARLRGLPVPGRHRLSSTTTSAPSARAASPRTATVLSAVAPGELNWVLCSTERGHVRRVHQLRRSAHAGVRERRDERVLTADRRGRGPGDPGLREDPRRRGPEPGAGEAVHHQHRRRHPGPGRPPGWRSGRRLPGRPGRRVVPGAGAGPHRERPAQVDRAVQLDRGRRGRQSGLPSS